MPTHSTTVRDRLQRKIQQRQDKTLPALRERELKKLVAIQTLVQQYTLATGVECFYKITDMEKVLNKGWFKVTGTCVTENHDLYLERITDDDKSDVLLMKAIIHRQEGLLPSANIMHAFVVYFEKEHLIFEDRSNGYHKKYPFKDFIKCNKILELVEIDVDASTIKDKIIVKNRII